MGEEGLKKLLGLACFARLLEIFYHHKTHYAAHDAHVFLVASQANFKHYHSSRANG